MTGPGMRILSVMTQVETAGAQAVAIDLHRAFKRRGIESKLVFLYRKDQLAFPQNDYECCVEGQPRGLGAMQVFSRLRRVWRDFAPDVVLAHTWYSINYCALGKISGLPGLMLPVHHNLYGIYPASSRLFDRLCRRIGVYPRELAIAEAVDRSLPHVRIPRAIVPNGQNLQPSPLSKQEARAVFGLPSDIFLVGNIGRLVEQKNQMFLVELLARVPPVHLVILGRGELRDALLSRAEALGVKDRLTILPGIVREQVPDILAALDLFALPSLEEGQSIAMLEALGLGVPFIGNDVPTISDVLNTGNGSAGIVLPLALDRWQEEITRLVSSPAALEQLATAACAQGQRFSVDTMVDRYLDVAKNSFRPAV